MDELVLLRITIAATPRPQSALRRFALPLAISAMSQVANFAGVFRQDAELSQGGGCLGL